jgi:2-amino-4-hydroxy-6-hydroxymethyldihydropteridine diphosphokinase
VATAYIALGANLGDRLAALRQAVHDLSDAGMVTSCSAVYETAPVGFLDQPAYLNAAIQLQTELTPRQLLDALLRIETEHGRERTFRDAPRTLDLDILLFDDRIVDEPGLVIPHPRLHERPFVLAPLADIAPHVRHPVAGQSISALWQSLQATAAGVRQIPETLCDANSDQEPARAVVN